MMTGNRYLVLTGLLISCFALCGMVIATWTSLCGAEMAIRYKVALEGTSDKGLLAELKGASQLIALEDRPPATLDHLKKRAQEDMAHFQQVLRARGYYDGRVHMALDEKKEPVLVTVKIEAGTVYRMGSVELRLISGGEAAKEKLPSLKELGLAKGDPGRAAPIIAAQDKIVQKLRSKGYPFVKVSEKRAVVDHKAKTLSVTYLVDAGAKGRFGATTYSGLKSVKEKLLRGKLPWRRGQKFNGDLFNELRDRLTKTELFSIIHITHAESLDDDGMLPITVTVKERKHRTVTAGVRYYTDEGPGGHFSWEHRNLFHGGEDLKIDATVSAIEHSAEAVFKKPEFLRNDQTLALASRLAMEDTDAYTSQHLLSTVFVERHLDKTMQIGLGPGFRLERVKDDIEGRRDFGLLSLSSYLNWDTTDNLLDPTRGGRLNVKLSPYGDIINTNVCFLKGFASYSRYVKLMSKPFLVFASRAVLGVIYGAGRDAVPADLRFYSGGGGSVRGYPFQTLGPLEDDEPVGGASLFEINTELRFKVTKQIGFATFLDGGTAFESSYPDFSEKLRWGAGIGVRYHTPFGPLRFDVAVPLQRRPDVDDNFQVYLSLGQAF